MKNLFNIGFVVLLLVVLGCNCQKFKDMANESGSTPSSSPSTSSSPSKTSTSSSPSNKSGLSMEQFNKIKNGMTLKEVTDIMGGEGVQQSSSGEGKYKVETYKWEGEQFQFVSVVFMGGKVYSKVQANLK